MPQKRILRIGHIETGADELIEQVLGKLPVNGTFEFVSSVFGDGRAPGDNCESRQAGHGECLQVVTPHEKENIRLGLIQDCPQLPHGRRRQVQVTIFLFGGSGEKIGRMAGRHCRNDLTHTSFSCAPNFHCARRHASICYAAGSREHRTV